MFFRENPFYLLGVHSRDTAEAIRTASLEKQGAARSGEEKHMYRMAEERLLHESSRFRAELSWLCGMGKERAYSLIGGTGNMEKRENLPPSLRLLLAVHDLYNGGKDAFSVMETIIRLYPASDTNEVLARLEADRKIGGFPPIKELFPLDIRKEELLWEMGVAAGRLNAERFGRFLTALGKTDVPCSMALARFLSLYEEKTKAEVAALSRDLRYALRLAEDRLTESVPYPKRKLERTTAVPKTVDRIPAVTLPRQSGGAFYVCLAGFLTAAVLCRYFFL